MRAEFRANADKMRALTAELQARRAEAALGGPEKSRERHVARGKLLPRERVMNLIDPGSPFLELSPLAANGMYDDAIHGAGLITGIGRIEGRECVIVCNDSTIKGGTYYPMTVKKHLRAQEIARENRLPCIYLVDSGGANLPHQTEVFPDREHFGRIFYNQATLSALGIPQIAVVMGSCTAGGAYVPAMSDETIIVQEPGHHLPRRPAAGEGRDRRGGDARRISAAPTCTRANPASPITMAQDDHHALSIARRIVANLNTKKTVDIPLRAPREPALRRRRARRHRAGRPEEAVRRARGDRAPGRRLRVRRVQALYGTTLVTGFAHIHGMPVGILGNNGILFSESALKAAHFIELCCQRRIPLLFLQNIVGFMVGRDYEAGGIAKDGAKMVTAVACAQVPKITLIVGGSLRRRQLRHVRARLRPALSVHLAERAHLGDGRRAGGLACWRPSSATISRPRARWTRGRGGGIQGADPRAIRGRGQSLLRHRAAVGRRHHRAERDAARAGAGVFRRAQRAGAGDEVRGV